MKTAMFGGSFNPIHNGHIQLAKAVRKQLGLDRVLIVPAFQPPHKEKSGMASGEARLAMCRLAFEGDPAFEVSDMEIRRQGASYTYLTLEELHAQNPDDELYLLMGADMFMTVHEWKHPEIIFSLAVVCGIPRNSDNAAVLAKQAQLLSTLGAHTRIPDTPVMTVSSTRIRAACAAGEDISALVPPSVHAYIREHQLYSAQG